MSISTHFSFHNATDPKFIAATSTPQRLAKWEGDNGPVAEYPGERLDDQNNAVEETEAEYGGWVIDLAKLPPGTTHIAVSRG